MKYLLLLVLSFFLFGCQLKTEAYIYKEKMSQPENKNREITTRSYTVLNTDEVITVSLPEDYIEAKEIRWRYPKLAPLLTDTDYWLPSKDFITDKLLPAYKKYLKINKIVYSRKFDCDDFSALFHAFSQKFYTDMVINKNAEAITVAELYYEKTTSFITDFPMFGIRKLPQAIKVEVESNHAINLILLDDSTSMFVEPQNGEEITLTIKEGKSIFFCKF